MRIVIAGGNHEADYIIKTFNKRGNKLVIINENQNVATYLSKSNKLDVYVDDITKVYVYEDVNAKDFDLFIALSDNDTDNYIACLIAKRLFNIRRCICTVSNPKNVELFKELGINHAVSATYLLAQAIKDETSFEEVVKTMHMENDRVVVTEILILEEFEIANKMIKDTNFPKYGNISCIFRNPEVIIPSGDNYIRPNDKLLVVSAPENQKHIVEFITREKHGD